MKCFFTRIALFVALLCMGVNAQASMYIVGNAPFGDWDPAKGLEMTSTDGVNYEATGLALSGKVYFVLTSAQGTWNDVNANRFGPTAANECVVLNAPCQSQKSTNTSAAYYVNATATDATYAVTFNTETNVLRVAQEGADHTGEMYVIGADAQLGGWSASKGLKMETADGNVFTAKIELSAQSKFRFSEVLASSFQKKYEYGAGTSMTITDDKMDTPIAVTRNDEHTFLLNAGIYAISFDLPSLTFTVTKAGNYDKVYILGEANGNAWAFDNGVEMATDNGVNYTATVNFAGTHTGGTSYFGFTSALGSSWDEIAASRFGGVGDGSVTIATEDFFNDITLTKENYQSFKIGAGDYTISVNVKTMTMTVVPVVNVTPTDADKTRCYIDHTDLNAVTFILDQTLWNLSDNNATVYVRGSFTGWGSDDAFKMTRNDAGFYAATVPYNKVKIPGNSGCPEYKFYVNGSYMAGDRSFITDGYIFHTADDNQIVVFAEDDFDQIKANSEIARTVKNVSDFDLTTEEGQMEVSNFRQVPGTKHLFRCYHPFKVSRAQYATEAPRMQYVQELSAKYGIVSDIVLSGDETATLTSYTIDGKPYTETIPAYYQNIIDNGKALYVGKATGVGTPGYNDVYFNTSNGKLGKWMKEVIEFINADDTPVPATIHCRLGTDRTGVFSGVIAALCGANWEDIATDYQKTNRMAIREFRDYHLLQYAFCQMLNVPNMAAVNNLKESMTAYLVDNGWTTRAEVEKMVEKLNGPTTAVTDVKVTDSTSEVYYTITGAQVDANSLAPGIYVTNHGRKVVVK